MRRKLLLEHLIEHYENHLGNPFKELDPFEKLRKCSYALNVGLDELLKKKQLTTDEEYMGKTNSAYINFINGFLQNRFSIYKIADRFGHHLSKTDLKIPSSVIPSKHEMHYCIELPMVFENDFGDHFNSAIISIYNIRLSKNKPEGPEFMVNIIAPDLDLDNKWKISDSFIALHFNKSLKTVEESIEQASKFMNNSATVTREFVVFVIKCLIYIESGEPDLIPSYIKPKVKTKAKLRKFYKSNFPYEVVNVGYRFQKEKLFHVKGTTVKGHFRWQPWGQKWSKVKLIWIDEYEKEFKNLYSDFEEQNIYSKQE